MIIEALDIRNPKKKEKKMLTSIRPTSVTIILWHNAGSSYNEEETIGQTLAYQQ